MDIVETHREKCTQCGKCLEVCPRYDDLDLIKILYGYLEGKSEIDSDSLLRCLTCGLCTDACPDKLGIKLLISPARQKWVNENGLTDRQTMVDPDAENNLFKKLPEWMKFLHTKTIQVLLCIFLVAPEPLSIKLWHRLLLSFWKKQQLIIRS